MTVIGTLENASLALTEALTHGHSGEHYFGSGGSRKAFLIDDVIYKVHHQHYYTSNFSEYGKWVDVFSKMTIPDDIAIRFVPVHMWTVDIDGVDHPVNAMPFIDGAELTYENGRAAMLPRKESDWVENVAGLFDICCDNAKFKDGYYYIVDGEL